MMNGQRLQAAALTVAALTACVSAAQGIDLGSGTRTANCIVRVLSPRDVMPINPDLINMVLRSSPVIGEPLREILGSTAKSYEDDVEVKFDALQSVEQKDYTLVVGMISVEIVGGGALESRAEEFLAELCERLEWALNATGARYEDRLNAVERELEALRGKYESMCMLRRELVEQAGQDDLDRDRIVIEVRELEERAAALRLRLAATSAREDAVTRNVALIAKQASDKAEQSPVLAELNNLIALKEKELAYSRQSDEKLRALGRKDNATSPETYRTEEALIQVRMQRAQYLAEAAEAAGADMLESFNRELIDLGIESETTEVELKLVESRLQEIRERRLFELADRFRHEIERPMRMLENMLDDLTQEQFLLREKMRQQRAAEVSVIGAD